MASVRKNDVLFVGMNKFVSEEAAALRKSGAKVDVISDAKANDTITVGKGNTATTYDLTTPSGREDFVKTLKLPAPQAAKIKDVLANAHDDARDELAQLAQAWAPGEKGGEVPGRLVLSGHSGGSSIYGDEEAYKFKNGHFDNDSFTKLAQAMPKAAAQVEDIALSACYCGGETGIDAWKAGFPNIKTVLAYADKSPSGASEYGSRAHLAKWEKFTRGDADSLKPEAFKGLEKANNIATWSIKNGYLTPGAQEKPEVVRARIGSFKPTYDAYFSGAKAVTSQTELRAHYDDLQDLSSRTSTPAAEVAVLKKDIETVFRLMKFDKVKANFQKDHGASTKAAYAELGLSAPDVSRLSRKEVLVEVAKFEAAAKAKSPTSASVSATLHRLTAGLRDLTDAAVIPRQGL